MTFPRFQLEQLESRLLLDASASLFQNVNKDVSFLATDNAILGESLIFAADDGTGVVGLWKSDGTSDGTISLRDGQSVHEGWLPEDFVAISDRVLFTASSQSGHALWSTDGTTDGTRLIREFSPSAYGQYNVGITLNDKVFFGGRTDELGDELWVSDGTTEGTRLVKDINPGPPDASVAHLLTLNNKLYFFAVAADPAQTGIWETDGTDEGTRFITQTSFLRGLIPFGDKLLYATHPAAAVYELDVTTGQSKNIYQDDSNTAVWIVNAGESAYLLVWNSLERDYTLHHIAADELAPKFLGTVRSFPFRSMAAVGSNLFFIVDGELWRSDGTLEGTIRQPNLDANVSDLMSIGDTLYFRVVDHPTFGTEPARINGEEIVVLDIEPGIKGSSAMVFGGDNNKAYAWWGDGRGLWVTNGTTEGTDRINVAISGPTDGSNPRVLTPVTGGIAFLTQRQLWFTDGTDEGTHRIADFNASGLSSLIPLNGKAFFTQSSRLWVTDGTREGTTKFLTTEGNEFV
jgi:ELWxxDGT repeat protein